MSLSERIFPREPIATFKSLTVKIEQNGSRLKAFVLQELTEGGFARGSNILNSRINLYGNCDTSIHAAVYQIYTVLKPVTDEIKIILPSTRVCWVNIPVHSSKKFNKNVFQTLDNLLVQH